jgi:1-acyl-sn-glycerol-3-phosphate acyltransferase
MSYIFRALFKLSGWKLVGQIPKEIRKGVISVCPHNSWIDFPVGLGARAAINRKIGFIGKEELFKGPFGFIFKALGGTPAIRTSNNNMVQSYVAAIENSEDMLFALAPEGTRKDVAKLRTGFYFMAHGGKIPIIRIGFDYATKSVFITEPFYTSGNFELDMQKYFVPFFEKMQNPKSWVNNYKKGIF